MQFLMLEAEVDGQVLTLSSEVHRRLRKVLRLPVGDRVSVVSRGGHGRGEGVLLPRGKLRLEHWEPLPPDPHPDVTLYLPPLKGDRLEWAARSCFELGLAGLTLYHSERCQIPPPPRLRGRLDAVALAACEQSGRLHLPELVLGGDLDQILEAACQQPRQLFLLHPGGAPWPATLPLSSGLVVGPEGGFTREEVERASRAGAQILGLAGHVLRAETAAVVATTLALSRSGWLLEKGRTPLEGTGQATCFC
jgi:16S rRNA (uracil1498-N3)-methyltransferase